MSFFRIKVAKFIKSHYFYNFILTIIVLNAIIIGLQTNTKINEGFSDFLEFLNHAFLIIFLIEFSLRIYVYRAHFFHRKWDVFDLFVVLISIVPETSVVSVFRFLRVTRILRLVSLIPKIQFITQVLLRTLSSIISIGVLLMVVYYIYAVISTTLYGQDFPQWFGSIGESYYTLFQIMTFESWSMGIVRPVMEKHPYAWIVFVSFLVIATYIVLNIVIGIIVDCIGEIKDSNKDLTCEKSELLQDEILNKINGLEKEIKNLQNIIVNMERNK